jgi:hypothetical protein
MKETPPTVNGPSAWYGPDVAGRSDWIEALSAVELAEIESASRQLAQADRDWATLRRADFPLPTLSGRLDGILDEVLQRRGFVLLRGLPVEAWGRRLSAVAFLGLGLHLGSLRSQNRQGHLLGHVKDLGLTSSDPNVRIYQTKERQNYHTDSCDVVGLLCLQPAKAGGLSSLVSSVTIFNEMQERRPDLARALFEHIETDRRGEVPKGKKPYFSIPVFNWYEGLFLFDALANDPALHFQMEFKTGDIQLVHNHTLLHDRTAFEDWRDPERKRHLLRLWLAPENARPLPPPFAERYGSVIPGQRGGIEVPGTRYTIPWEAEDVPSAS